MYEAYFGLKEKPFSITPDPGYLFLGTRHQEALAHLLYGIQERSGFVQLTGEVGTGKTTLTRALLEELPENVDVALVYNPGNTALEFLSAIFQELNIELPRRHYSAKALIDRLNEYLLDAFGRGRTTVLLVDEAQTLSPTVIEQTRLLTNLETPKEKLLQIILVGQPELAALLERQDLRQVAQRITARYHLRPLDRQECRDYIAHRLSVAGVDRPLFTPASQWLVHRLSRGVPRLVNVLCDRALLGAYAGGRNEVEVRTVLRAAREIGGGEGGRRRRFGLPVLTLLAAVMVALPGAAPDSPDPTASATAATER